MLWLYKQKGTDADILNAANYGNNDKWLGVLIVERRKAVRDGEL